jgi:hypothetical protein
LVVYDIFFKKEKYQAPPPKQKLPKKPLNVLVFSNKLSSDKLPGASIITTVPCTSSQTHSITRKQHKIPKTPKKSNPNCP